MSQVAVMVRPSSREVREFAKAQGMDVPERGRLPHAAYDLFNANRRGVHRYAGNVEVRTHTVYGPKGGVIRRKNYRVDSARDWAVCNGWAKPGARGRLSREALDAYIMSL